MVLATTPCRIAAGPAWKSGKTIPRGGDGLGPRGFQFGPGGLNLNSGGLSTGFPCRPVGVSFLP